jgi:hypothetical protein
MTNIEQSSNIGDAGIVKAFGSEDLDGGTENVGPPLGDFFRAGDVDHVGL